MLGECLSGIPESCGDVFWLEIGMLVEDVIRGHTTCDHAKLRSCTCAVM